MRIHQTESKSDVRPHDTSLAPDRALLDARTTLLAPAEARRSPPPVSAPVQMLSRGAAGLSHAVFQSKRFTGSASGEGRDFTPAEDDAAAVHEAASFGTRGGGRELPYLDRIQRSFGAHDIRGVRAHMDADAADGARRMGAEAFTMGDRVAFAGAASLRAAAHEAAHVVQQRAGVELAGGVGEVGDRHERHADAVADRVVQERSSEGLLSEYARGGPGAGASGPAVQRLKTEKGHNVPVDLNALTQDAARDIDSKCRDGIYVYDNDGERDAIRTIADGRGSKRGREGSEASEQDTSADGAPPAKKVRLGYDPRDPVSSAKAAISYVKGIIQVGAGNVRESVRSSEGRSKIAFEAGKKLQDDRGWRTAMRRVSDPVGRICWRAGAAAKAKAGNCQEHADLTFMWFLQNTEGLTISYACGEDHAYVIIGDPEERGTWTVVDPWPYNERIGGAEVACQEMKSWEVKGVETGRQQKYQDLFNESKELLPAPKVDPMNLSPMSPQELREAIKNAYNVG